MNIFINSQLLINILISSSIILMSGLSFSILYFSAKFFNLTHGIIIAMGAYLNWYLYEKLHLNLILTSVISIVTCIILGVFFDWAVYRQLRQRLIQPIYFLISAIALYTIFQNIFSAIWGDEAKTLNTVFLSPSHNLLGGYITSAQCLLVFVSLISFMLYNWLINNYDLGKMIRAVSENAELSRIHGIDSEKVITICTVIASAFGAILGICMSFDSNITPSFGFNLLLSGVVAMIIGGLGSYKGLIFGSLLIASLQQVVGFYFSSKWMDCIVYLILLVFLIWKPFGFSGVRARKTRI